MSPPFALVYDGPMSDGEIAVTVMASIAWFITGSVWIHGLRARKHVFGVTPWKGPLQWSQLLALAVVVVILKLWSASDVRDDGRYLFMYSAIGGAWIGVAMFFTGWLGLSTGDDVVERRNPAAAVALFGLPFAVALTYAGGNIGDGPGWWVVFFSSGLATCALFLLAVVGLSIGGASESITIERDTATGARFAFATIAEAVVLARAAAGDWVSAKATVSDFVARGWPALVLAVAAIAFDRALRPTHKNLRPSVFASGVLPGLVLLAAAAAWVVWLGALP
ncbi:MAG TPA: hypothetical protein VK843_08155 [Planctomycetota bacterium]|nr:hypothetical protein [Planctomycetota bacterium]